MNNKIHMCIDKGQVADGVYNKAVEGKPIAIDVRFRWPKEGKTLKIKFLDGDPSIINIVKEKFGKWLAYAKNIKYEYVTDGDADVRVAFEPNGQSWSYIGKEILDQPQSEPTMNFGWFDSSTSDEEFERVAVHEMGHTLGFIHEQSQPLADIDWDEEKVYEYYRLMDGWDKDTTFHNVLERYSKKITQYSEFDPVSIMQYFVDGQLTKSGKSIPGGNKLSDLDKKYATMWYS